VHTGSFRHPGISFFDDVLQAGKTQRAGRQVVRRATLWQRRSTECDDV